MCANSEGVPKDAKEAVKCYRLVADQGRADAKSRLQRIKKKRLKKPMVNFITPAYSKKIRVLICK
jgi:TPR repeat protein